jgi:hypothetical protein
VGVSRLCLVADHAEVARRRPALPPGVVVEAWPDLYSPGSVWVGAESKQLLDAAGGAITPLLSLEAEHVPIFYGPRLADLDSLPTEDSLRTRVLSAHGVAVAWITLDRFGERTEYQPESPLDPTFFLRRRGGGAAHVWRLFRTRDEAGAFMRERYASDPEAQAWADALAVADFAELIERYATPGPPPAS